jgi:hypothetical protein
VPPPWERRVLNERVGEIPVVGKPRIVNVRICND